MDADCRYELKTYVAAVAFEIDASFDHRRESIPGCWDTSSVHPCAWTSRPSLLPEISTAFLSAPCPTIASLHPNSQVIAPRHVRKGPLSRS